MKLSVKFYTYEDGEDTEIGTLIFDGTKFYWEKLVKPWLKETLDEPIYVDEEHIYSNKTPKKFIKNLHNSYNSIYLRASKAMVSK